MKATAELKMNCISLFFRRRQGANVKCLCKHNQENGSNTYIIQRGKIPFSYILLPHQLTQFVKIT